MSTSPVTLDFSKAQPVQQPVSLDFSKAQPIGGAPTVSNEPIPSGFWQSAYESSGVKSLVDMAKQQWSDAQAGKDAETEMLKNVSQSLKSGNYGQAAETLLAHLATGGTPAGSIVGNIAQNSYQHGKAAFQAVESGDPNAALSQSIKAIPIVGSMADAGASTLGTIQDDADAGNNAGAAGAAAGFVAPLAAGALGGEALEGAEGAEAAEPVSASTPLESVATQNAAKSGIAEGADAVTDAPADTSQAPLQQGIRDVLNQAASDNDLDPIPDSVSVRDVAQKLANQFKVRSQATFNNVEKVTGVNVTSLRNQIAALTDKIDDAAIDDPEKAGVLQNKKLAFEDQAQRAFDDARDKGLDIDTARSDWNKNLRASELSQKIRNADDGTVGSPNLNAGRLTKPLQKMLDDSDGRGGALQQLLGEDNANTLVQHAENARSAGNAVKEFTPTTATGQKALQAIIKSNTGTGITGRLTNLPQARTLVGMNPSTNWLGVYRDIGNLSSDEQAVQFGADAPKVNSFVKAQARAQAVKEVAKIGGVAALAKATGLSSGALHLLVGE
jgi:hypothetical protein